MFFEDSDWVSDISATGSIRRQRQHQQATQDEKRNVSRSFMLVEDGQLLGYYTLANASVVESDLSEEQMKKMPHYPMPAILLSRHQSGAAQSIPLRAVYFPEL
jgi:hypothetical protein